MIPWGFLIACVTQSMGRDISLSQGDVQVQAPFPVVSWLDPCWAFGPMRFLAVSPSITCFLNLTSFFYYFYLSSRFSSPKRGKSNIVFFCGLLLNLHITLVLFISFLFFFFAINCCLLALVLQHSASSGHVELHGGDRTGEVQTREPWVLTSSTRSCHSPTRLRSPG